MAIFSDVDYQEALHRAEYDADLGDLRYCQDLSRLVTANKPMVIVENLYKGHGSQLRNILTAFDYRLLTGK